MGAAACGQRVDAFRASADDVAGGAYPGAKHQLDMDDAAYESFLSLRGRFEIRLGESAGVVFENRSGAN